MREPHNLSHPGIKHDPIMTIECGVTLRDVNPSSASQFAEGDSEETIAGTVSDFRFREPEKALRCMVCTLSGRATDSSLSHDANRPVVIISGSVKRLPS